MDLHKHKYVTILVQYAIRKAYKYHKQYVIGLDYLWDIMFDIFLLFYFKEFNPRVKRDNPNDTSRFITSMGRTYTAL